MTKINLFVKSFPANCLPGAQVPFNSNNNNRQPGGACGKNGRRLRTGVYAVFLACAFLVSTVTVTAQQPAISSFSPSSGPVGTLVTISGTDLSNPTSLTIGGVNAIVISGTATKAVAMVMPGAMTGQVSLATAGGSITATGSFTVIPGGYPTAQQSDMLSGSDATENAQQGHAVSMSADGNTALVGGNNDDNKGAAWVYIRNNAGEWTQQGNKLTGAGAIGLYIGGPVNYGVSVSLSADGNTALVGGDYDDGGKGAAWVYTRSGGVWTQQGGKLVGTGAVGVSQHQGVSVSLSADGNTALVGGSFADNGIGAAWVYSRSGGVWTQLGNKLVGNDANGGQQGISVSLSADGNTALVGGIYDDNDKGAVWIFTRNGGLFTQKGGKLVGSGATGNARMGNAVSLSADGNTALVGGSEDDGSKGAAWVFTLTNGDWIQQGSKLKGGNVQEQYGYAVSLSADGNTALVGGNGGYVWLHTRSGGVWTPGSKLYTEGYGIGAEIGAGGVQLSADGSRAVLGSRGVSYSTKGAAWVFENKPLIIAQKTINGFGSVCSGSTKAPLSFTVSGTAFQAPLKVTVPAGFEVSTTASSGYAPDISLTALNGAITTTTLYIRISATAPTGALSGAIVSTSANAATRILSITGSVNALPLTPTLGAGTATTFCAGGSVLLTSNVESGNTRYAWYKNNTLITEITNPVFTSTATGSYTVRVTDVNNCTSAPSIPVAVTVNALPLTPTINAGSATTFCAGGSVSLTSNAASGNKWYVNNTVVSGATNAVFMSTGAGSYTVRVTDVNNCTSAASIPVAVTVNALPLTPTINAAGATTFCAGGSVLLTSNAASGNKWYVNNTVVSGATNAVFTSTGTGSYSVRVTDVNNCTSAASIPVAVTVNALPSTPTINAGSATTFCLGAQVVLTSNASTGNQWLLNGSPINNATASIYTANTSGNYSVRVTDGNSCTSADATATAVTVNPIPATPVISTSTPTTFCSGASVVLTSSASTGNQWLLNGSPISNATGSTYTANASGNYSVRVTSVNGCTGADAPATAVTVNPLPATPVISTTTPIIFCIGGQVVLTSNASTGNQWLVNGSPINNATGSTYTANTSGNYSVRVTDGNSCTSADATAKAVTVNPLPATPVISTTTPTTFCSGASVVLTSSASTGNQWLLNGSPISNATGSTYTANTSGNYSVRVTDGNSCTGADATAKAVTVNPLPATPVISTTTPTIFCIGGQVVLTSSASTGNQWLLNGSPINNATGSTYTANTSGNYSVRVTDGNSCTSADATATAVTADPIPATPVISNTTPTTFCSGASVVLTSSASTGNQWLLNGSPISNATGSTYTANASGNYSVRVTSVNGCTGANAPATAVTVNPLPATPVISTTTPTTFCTGGQVVITSNTSTGNQWLLNGSPINNATGSTYTANTSGNYSVRVTDGNNCTSAATAATAVTVNPFPSGTIAQTGLATNVTAGFTLTAPAGSVYAWSTGEKKPSVTAQSSGNYSVVVTSAQGCQSQFTTQVVLPSLADATKISIPNSFSPNGDGINDYWTIPELKNYPNAQVTIVNRNGSVVYQSSNTMPQWDGKYKGKDLPGGVYFYNVQPIPGLALKSGWVNLLR